jgi:hypothetical protein
VALALKGLRIRLSALKIRVTLVQSKWPERKPASGVFWRLFNLRLGGKMVLSAMYGKAFFGKISALCTEVDVLPESRKLKISYNRYRMSGAQTAKYTLQHFHQLDVSKFIIL